MTTNSVKSPDGKEFEIYIDRHKIAKRIQELGATISKDYQGKDLLFLVILNGAFVFTSDLLRNLNIPNEVSFIRGRKNKERTRKKEKSVRERLKKKKNEETHSDCNSSPPADGSL